MSDGAAPALIDAHGHLADPRLEGDASARIAEARRAGIALFFQGGVSPEDWDRQDRLAERFPPRMIRPIYGLHPWWAARERLASELELAFADLEKRLPGAVALGELGLDYYPTKFGPETHLRQRACFERQLALAVRYDKPLVLHVVKAHAEVIATLKSTPGAERLGGIVHAFQGNATIAKSYVELGLKLSVGRAVLRSGYENLKRALRQVPLENWVIESDTPDQLEPAKLREVAMEIARLRGISFDEVAKSTRRATLAAFRCSEASGSEIEGAVP